MSTIIYCFSATGNSLKVARDLAGKLGETKLVQIADIENMLLDFSPDKIGFVFPVYIWGLPSIVDAFLQRIDNLNQEKYVFAVATCKSSPGAVLQQLQKKLEKIKANLSAGFTVYMPGNYIIGYETDSTEVQQDKFREWEKQVDVIASTINNSGTCTIKKGQLFSRFLLTGILHKLISGTFHNADKHFWTDDNCMGCGICSEVCPVNNIDIVDNKPVWKHNCEQCVACINLCPRQAIQYSENTIGRGRYKNPFVELDDLLRDR